MSQITTTAAEFYAAREAHRESLKRVWRATADYVNSVIEATDPKQRLETATKMLGEAHFNVLGSDTEAQQALVKMLTEKVYDLGNYAAFQRAYLAKQAQEAA